MQITFKPAGMIVTDVFANDRHVGMLRKEKQGWRFHARGDLQGVLLTASATLARRAAIEILSRQ